MQPADLSVTKLIGEEIPLDWADQERLFARFYPFPVRADASLFGRIFFPDQLRLIPCSLRAGNSPVTHGNRP